MSEVSTRRRQQVERASQEWRSALIDVSGNNRLLFFRSTAATLDLADADPSAVDELLAGATVRLSRLFTDPLQLTVVQRACKALAGKQREAQEEYGVAVAFCAFGLATWARSPDELISETEIEATLDEATGEVRPTREGEAALGATSDGREPRDRGPRNGASGF